MEIKMEENKNIELGAELDEELVEEEVHYKEMSPTRMVVRRFFRSRLSLVGVIMLAALFTFAFLGPMFRALWSRVWMSGCHNLWRRDCVRLYRFSIRE